MTLPNRTCLALALLACLGSATANAEPLPVAALERDTPVDFAGEIVPFLKKNCFACHNERKAKADLNLESPQAMVTGGDSGPAVVPGKPLESLVFTYAAHLEDDPMPPAKNKSNAENLSPDELALLKLWIEQGAKGTSAALLAGPAEWRPLDDVHSIYAVAVSDDGRFAACGRGNRIHVYDLRTGTLAAELRDPEAGMETAHLDHVHALAFNRYGTLASGGYRTVKFWERHTNPPARLPYGLPEAATALACDSSGNMLAAGDGKGNLVVQPLAQTEKAAAVAVHGGAVRAVVFDPKGEAVYSASDDKTVARAPLPDLKDAAKVTLPSECLSLALLEGGEKVAAGCADGIIRVIPAASFALGAAPETLPPPAEFTGHGAKVIALRALDPAGTQLLSASEDGSVRIWDAAGKQLREINHGGPIAALDLQTGTGRLATAGSDGGVRVWDANDGKKLGELTANPDFEHRRNSATRKRDLTKRIVELRQKELGEHEKQWNEFKEKAKTEAEKLAAAGKELEAKSLAAQARREETARLQREAAALEAAQDPELGTAREVLKKSEEELNKAEGELANAERAFTEARRNSALAVRDGVKAGERFLATHAAAAEAAATLAAAEEAVKGFEGDAGKTDDGAIRALAFSQDQPVIAVGTEKSGVRLWSSETFLPLDTLLGDSTALAIAADGRLIAALAGKSFASWSEPVSWRKVRQLGDAAQPDPFPDRVLALAFHPRGHLLATGSGVPSRNAQLKFWNVRDGSPAGAVEKAHEDTITGLAFSPDGARIASGSTDRFVKVHDVETQELLDQLEGHTGHVLDVAWSADGETLASAGADNVAKLWVAAEGRQKKTEGGFNKELSAIAFLGAGEELLVGSGDKTVKAAGQNLGGVEGFVYDVAATPDGATIIAGGEDGVLRVWQAQDRKLLHSFPPPDKQTPETAAN